MPNRLFRNAILVSKRSCGRNEEGQATLEFALLLPFALLLIAALAEVGMLAADSNRVTAAAREAARAAAVTSDLEAIEDAAEIAGLPDPNVRVSPRPELRIQGEPVEVTVTYELQGHLPVAGWLVKAARLSASAAMRIERP